MRVMAKIMYMRVSTEDQNLARQEDAAKKINPDKVFADKKSGTNFERVQYKKMKEYIREGDTVYFLSIDRMGRNYDLIKKEWEDIRSKGVHIHIIDMPLLNTDRKVNAADGKMDEVIANIVLELLCYMAEKEREMNRARQAAGIARAKKEGKYKGRKPIDINIDDFERMQKAIEAKERTHQYAMKQFNLKEATYYRILKQYREGTGRFKREES